MVIDNQTQGNVMNEHLRVKEVAKLVGGIAVSTVWLWIKTKNFPKPYKLAGRVTVWKKSEVDTWIENQIEVAS